MRSLDLRVVLVRPHFQRNIGAAARALDNMGPGRLILIGPRCEVSDEARMAAASAGSVLAERTTYQDWSEFLAQEPRGLSFGLTSRDGTDRQVRPLTEVLESFKREHPLLSPSASTETNEEAPLVFHLVFGPEEDGLSSEDLRHLQTLVNLPVYGENPSLNLAQAVLLTLFVIQDRWGQVARPARNQQTLPKADSQDFPDESFRLWLEEMDFLLSPPKTNAFTILRRLILRAAPTKKELHIFEGALRRSWQRMRSGPVRPKSADASVSAQPHGPDGSSSPDSSAHH